MKLRFVLFVFFAVCCADSVFAQGFSFRYMELSVSEGESMFTNKKFVVPPPQSLTPLNGVVKFSTKNRHEARLNFYTTSHFGAEAFYSFEKNQVVYEQTTAPASSIAVPLEIHNFGMDILYYPVGSPDSKWRPFIFIGGGAKIYRPSGLGQSIAKDPLQGNFATFFESSHGSFSYGGGVKRTLNKSFSARLDVGNQMTAVPLFGLSTYSPLLPNDTVIPIGGNINNPFVSVGIILKLGK